MVGRRLGRQPRYWVVLVLIVAFGLPLTPLQSDDASAVTGESDPNATLTLVKLVDSGDDKSSFSACDVELDVVRLTPPDDGLVGTFSLPECDAEEGRIQIGLQIQDSNGEDFQITEPGIPPGYVLTFGGDCAASGIVNLGVGERKTCTLTNTYVGELGDPDPNALLTVIKQVENGENDHPITVCDVALQVDNVTGGGAQPVASFQGSPDCDNPADPNHGSTEVGVDATPPDGVSTSRFQIAESDLTSDEYVATFSGDCDNQGRLDLLPGEHKTCVVTNTFLGGVSEAGSNAALTLVKVVDPAGAEPLPNQTTCDFDITVERNDGTEVGPFNMPDCALESQIHVGLHVDDQIPESGDFVVSEPNLLSEWVLTFDGDCGNAGQVTLLPGEHKTCELTNTYVGHLDDISEANPNALLTVIKQVENEDDSKSSSVCEFQLQVDNITTGTPVKVADFPGSRECDSGDPADPLNGSTILGLDATPPSTGGNAQYQVSEPGLPPDYIATFSGDCDLNGVVDLLPGEHKTCIVTNTYTGGLGESQPNATLTLTKIVDNSTGKGNSDTCDVELAVEHLDDSTANTVDTFMFADCGTEAEINIGLHIDDGLIVEDFLISETSRPPGYVLTFDGDCDAIGVVSLSAGEHKTCELTNTYAGDLGDSDPNAILTVIKEVENGANDHPQSACDFQIQVDKLINDVPEQVATFSGSTDCTTTSGSTTVGINVDTNLTTRYQVSEPSPPSDYLPTFSGDCEINGQLDLLPGEHKTCIVTNTFVGDAAAEVNSPPTANAGPGQTVDEGDTVTLDGSDSSDPDGDTLSYSWALISSTGPAVSLSDASAVQPTFATTDDGSYTFELTVDDGQGESDTDQVTITVVNVAPVADDDTFTTDEDTTLNVSAPGVLDNDTDVPADSLTASLDTGPSNGTLNLNADGSFDYTPNSGFTGDDTFTCVASDGSLDSNVATVTITVNSVNSPDNVAPVAIDDTYEVDEDTELVIEASGILSNDSDADGDALTAVLVDDVNSGSLTLNADGSFSYTPDADFNGSDSFTYVANDGSGNSNVATVTITVIPVNDPPEVSSNQATVTVDEGQMAQATGTVSDIDGDAVTLSASVGAVVGNGDGTWTWSYFTSDGPAESDTVTVTANDGNGGISTATFELTVNNVAPSVTPAGNQTVDEGTELSLEVASFTDPGMVDTHTASIDWGDGTVENAVVNQGVGSGSVDGAQTYDDNGSYTVTVEVCDDDSGCDSATFDVVVNNVAPTATINSPGPVDEGDTFTIELTNPFDPSSADTDAGFSYVFDCGDGSGYSTPASVGSVDCPAVDDSDQNARAKIIDKDGSETEYTVDVTINNDAPTVGEITAPTDPVAINMEITASASFTDPGMLDTHTAEWDWGDGATSAAIVTEVDGSGTVEGSHIYTEPGVHTVTLTVTDKDGASEQSIFQYVVVYDPDGGFVTGGGWIWSPEGAYAADLTLSGKASFGFVSKYKKGANVPTGNTEFRFHAGDLNFASTEYEWLVIAGSRAQFKGSGTINGIGDYGFLLTAIDGDINGGGDSDKFRIQIWDKATDEIVYDNQMGEDDYSDATTELGGGSIVIHENNGGGKKK